jgi:protein transport protein SEC9
MEVQCHGALLVICIVNYTCLRPHFTTTNTTTVMFFKKKEQNLIPPVASEASMSRSTNSTSPRPSYRSNASSYVSSRDGDLSGGGSAYSSRTAVNTVPTYRAPGSEAATPREYSRNSSVTDKYSRGEGRLDDDRNELFSGYNPEKARGSGRFFDGPDLNNGRPPPNPGEETEEDVEGIKQQTRYLKQESVNSTRNALRLAREAEETARNTLGRLGDQSGKLRYQYTMRLSARLHT